MVVSPDQANSNTAAFMAAQVATVSCSSTVSREGRPLIIGSMSGRTMPSQLDIHPLLQSSQTA